MLIRKESLEAFCTFVNATYGTIVTIHSPKADDEHARWVMGGRVFVVLDYSGSEEGTLLEVVSGDKGGLEKVEQLWLGAIVGTLEDIEDE